MNLYQHDLLSPLEEDNREETIFVELEGLILPEIDMLLEQVRFSPKARRDRYPNIDQFDQIDFDQFYFNFSFYTPESFLRYLSDFKLDHDTIMKDYEDMASIDVLHACHVTLFSYGLREILAKPFTKMVYFGSTRTIQPHTKRFIRQFFADSLTKIAFVEGDCIEFIADHSELTSIFLNHSSILEELLAKPVDEVPFDKTFIQLRISFDTVKFESDKFDEANKPTMVYIKEARLQELKKDRNCMIAYILVNCIVTHSAEADVTPVG